MLRLLLVRHAEAAPAAGEGDIGRRLTLSGRKAAARIGVYLDGSGLAPDLALVSPARRALETFEELRQGLGRDIAASSEPALYNSGRDAALAALRKRGGAARTVLMIGHNPSLAEMAAYLSRTGAADALAGLRRYFPAPCLAVIVFEGGVWGDVGESASRDGRLERFVTAGSSGF